MTNFEKMTKEEMVKTFGQVFEDAYQAYRKLDDYDEDGFISYCDKCPLTNCPGHTLCKDNLEDWLNQEEEILDETEKKYLKNVLKPFLNNFKGIKIERVETGNGKCWLSIYLYKEKYNYDYSEAIDFPTFRKGEMYVGMKPNTEYTVEELGLR